MSNSSRAYIIPVHEVYLFPSCEPVCICKVIDVCQGVLHIVFILKLIRVGILVVTSGVNTRHLNDEGAVVLLENSLQL